MNTVRNEAVGREEDEIELKEPSIQDLADLDDIFEEVDGLDRSQSINTPPHETTCEEEVVDKEEEEKTSRVTKNVFMGSNNCISIIQTTENPGLVAEVFEVIAETTTTTSRNMEEVVELLLPGETMTLCPLGEAVDPLGLVIKICGLEEMGLENTTFCLLDEETVFPLAAAEEEAPSDSAAEHAFEVMTNLRQSSPLQLFANDHQLSTEQVIETMATSVETHLEGEPTTDVVHEAQVEGAWSIHLPTAGPQGRQGQQHLEEEEEALSPQNPFQSFQHQEEDVQLDVKISSPADSPEENSVGEDEDGGMVLLSQKDIQIEISVGGIGYTGGINAWVAYNNYGERDVMACRTHRMAGVCNGFNVLRASGSVEALYLSHPKYRLVSMPAGQSNKRLIHFLCASDEKRNFGNALARSSWTMVVEPTEPTWQGKTIKPFSRTIKVQTSFTNSVNNRKRGRPKDMEANKRKKIVDP